MYNAGYNFWWIHVPTYLIYPSIDLLIDPSVYVSPSHLCQSSFYSTDYYPYLSSIYSCIRHEILGEDSLRWARVCAQAFWLRCARVFTRAFWLSHFSAHGSQQCHHRALAIQITQNDTGPSILGPVVFLFENLNINLVYTATFTWSYLFDHGNFLSKSPKECPGR